MGKRTGAGLAFGDVATRAAQNAYDGTAAVGRATSWMGLIMGSVFGLLLVALGIFMLFQKPPARPKDNEKDAPPPPPIKLFGVAMLGFGIIIISFAVLGWYIAQKSKLYAAATGVGNILNVAT